MGDMSVYDMSVVHSRATHMSTVKLDKWLISSQQMDLFIGLLIFINRHFH